MLMRVLKSLNKKMFGLIKIVPLLFRISLIPYAEVSMDNLINACNPWPGVLWKPYKFREQHEYCSQGVWKDNTVKFFTSILSQPKNVDI